MTEEVKRVVVRLAGLGRDGLEINPAVSELLDNLGALSRVGPAGAEVFEAGANRATIVMCWILAVDHLYDYVFTRHLAISRRSMQSWRS